MKKHPSLIKKLGSLLLILMLASTLFVTAAFAGPDWSALSITISWTNADGTEGTAYAVPVEWSADQSFWAQIMGEQPGAVSVSCWHPDHPDWTYSPEWIDAVMYADAADGQTATVINAFTADGQPADAYVLYISLQPVPQPSEETAPQPVEVTIPVQCQTEDGSVLQQMYSSCWSGNSVYIEAPYVEGYTVRQPSTITVTVDEMGYASPSVVTFTYDKNAPVIVEANVPVYYVAGDEVLGQVTITATSAEPVTVSAMPIDGYTVLQPDTVTVVVDENGNAVPAEIYFSYEKNAPVIAYADVTIVYVCGDTVLGQSMVQASSAEPVAVKAPEFEGYTVQEPASVTIIVDENGNAVPNEVYFYYSQNAPAVAYAEVPVVYICGDMILGQKTVTVTSEEPSTVYAPEMEGYTADEPQSVTVTVDASGAANPSEVYFYYTQNAPQIATADVLVVCAAGENVLGQSVVTVTSEEPYTANAPAYEGYTLLGEPSVTITVSKDGHAEPSQVTFLYKANEKPAEPTVVPTEEPVSEPSPEPTEGTEPEPEATSEPVPASATVTFVYQTVDGNVLQSAERSFDPGTYNITAPQADGYAIVGAETVTLVVNADGTASQTTITFTYEKIPEEPVVVEVTVPVSYVDSEGRTVADPETRVLTDGVYVISASPVNLAERYVLISDGVVNVTVENGAADPAQVTFIYEKPLVYGTVMVRYTDESGTDIAPAQSVTVTGGTETTINPGETPAGYSVFSAKPVTIVTTDDGIPTPDAVTFIYRLTVEEQPIADGAYINRWGNINDKQVRVRADSNKKAGTVCPNLAKDTKVWVIQSVTNSKKEKWYNVLVNGVEGYIMSSFVDVMTQLDSDIYSYESGEVMPVYPLEPDDEPEEAPTEVPTEAPVVTTEPTAEPEAEPSVEPTAAPSAEPTLTAEPTQAPVVTPEATEEPEQYTGYALTKDVSGLRTEVSTADNTLIMTLAKNTLVMVSGQTYSNTGAAWSYVATMDNSQGYIPDASLRHINEQEADYYIRQWNDAQATPTPTVVPATPVPEQRQAFAYTIGDNVYFREMPSSMAGIKSVLSASTVVWVNGQQFVDGETWDIVQYNGSWGYIRGDMLKFMTPQEEVDYRTNLLSTPTPEPMATAQPYDVNSASSYGYVTNDKVNFRTGASQSSSRIMQLNSYAMCLILGTTNVDGTTWYHVTYNGKTGYISGNYFKPMTIAELDQFIGSENYRKGIENNSGAAGNNQDNTGGSSTGAVPTVVPAEDQTVSDWQNSGTIPSFAPFDPIATVAPLATATPDVSSPITTLAPGAQAPDTEDGDWMAFSKVYVTEGTTRRQVVSAAELQTLDINKLSVEDNDGNVYQLSDDNRIIYDAVSRIAYVSGIDAEQDYEPTATPLPEPTDIVYPQEENKGGIGTIILVIVIVLLLGGGGYGFFVFTSNKKKAQQRAAARRAAAQRQQSSNASAQQRPQSSRTGNMTNASGRPYQRPATAADRTQKTQNPFARPANKVNSTTNPYARPVKPAADTEPTVETDDFADFTKPATDDPFSMSSTAHEDAFDSFDVSSNSTSNDPFAPATSDAPASSARPTRRRRSRTNTSDNSDSFDF